MLFFEPDGAVASAAEDADGVRMAESFLLELGGAAGDGGGGLRAKSKKAKYEEN